MDAKLHISRHAEFSHSLRQINLIRRHLIQEFCEKKSIETSEVGIYEPQTSHLRIALYNKCLLLGKQITTGGDPFPFAFQQSMTDSMLYGFDKKDQAKYAINQPLHILNTYDNRSQLPQYIKEKWALADCFEIIHADISLFKRFMHDCHYIMQKLIKEMDKGYSPFGDSVIACKEEYNRIITLFNEVDDAIKVTSISAEE